MINHSELKTITKQNLTVKPKLPTIKNFNICCICLNEEK